MTRLPLASLLLGSSLLTLAACDTNEPAGDEADETSDTEDTSESESGESETGETGTSETETSESETTESETTETETTESETGDTEGPTPGDPAECEPGQTPVGTFLIDLDDFPEVEDDGPLDGNLFEYTGDCLVVDLSHFDGMLGMLLHCEHGLPTPVNVTVSASAAEPPTGVAAGTLLTLSATLGINMGGDAQGPDFYATANNRRYELTDAQGLVAAGAFGLGSSSYEFDEVSLSLKSCGPYEFGDEVQGYWQVDANGQTIGVAEGFVESIDGAVMSYAVSNFRSWLTCCHGHDVGVGVVRQ